MLRDVGIIQKVISASPSITPAPTISRARSAASQKIRGATLAQCIKTAIVNPYAFIPSGYTSGVMPNTFGKTLSPSQIQALVVFLRSVTK
jgi:hypothetical protein